MKGRHDGHSTVVLEVRVCLDPTNRVWSVHKFQSREDAALSLKWPGGGASALGHALLTEALRRETYTSALAALTADPDFLTTYVEAEEEKQRTIEAELGAKVRELIWITLGKMGADTAREVLSMMAGQLPKPEKTPPVGP